MTMLPSPRPETLDLLLVVLPQRDSAGTTPAYKHTPARAVSQGPRCKRRERPSGRAAEQPGTHLFDERLELREEV
jgi:hypothetical protein